MQASRRSEQDNSHAKSNEAYFTDKYRLKAWLALVLFLILLTNPLGAMQNAIPDPPSIEGRWDMTFDMAGKEAPGWLEIKHSGNHALVGHIVVIVGSVRPISSLNYINGKFRFSIPRQWEQGDHDLTFEGHPDGDRLIGTMLFSDGKTYNWTAVRAPALRRKTEPKWGTPLPLFNGKDLTGWHTNGKNQWKAENGILSSPHSGSNIITDGKFTDFKLHIEFRYPKDSNSGVYLRGRYEVQIEDNKGTEPSSEYFGGIYGCVVPSEMVARKPGEWQSFDITLIGRMITLVANGTTIISNQEIPGITGGALDSNEGEPGPIYLQGDHGPIEYRNIVLTPGE